MSHRYVLFALALLAITCSAIRGEDIDAVADELSKAKAALDDAVKKANTLLESAFETKIKEVAATGNLDAVKRLIAEKESFEADGKLPVAREMKAAAAQQQQVVKKAREAMEAAYDKAVRQYTKDLKLDKASSIKTEWEVFKARTGAGVATPSTPTAIVIHAAFYGQNISWIDITDKVRDSVRDKTKWATVVNTGDWGEPAPGFQGPRTLIIRYSLDGVTKSKWAYQGDKLTIP